MQRCIDGSISVFCFVSFINFVATVSGFISVYIVYLFINPRTVLNDNDPLLLSKIYRSEEVKKQFNTTHGG